MRGLPVRRVASTALCACLALGVAAPAALAADGSAGERSATAHRAPVPGTDALLAQTKALASMGPVVTPVTDLLTDALKANDGKLTPEQALSLAGAVRTAIARIMATAPAAPETPAAPALPATPPKPPGAEKSAANDEGYAALVVDQAMGEAMHGFGARSHEGMLAKSARDDGDPAEEVPAAAEGGAPPPDSGPGDGRAVRADAASDAVTAVQNAVNALVASVTSGVGSLTSAVGSVLSSLTSLLTSTLGSLTSSVPSTSAVTGALSSVTGALPAAPALPATPKLPVGG